MWQRGDSTVLLQHLTELQGYTAAGIHSVAGTDIFAERFGAVPQLVVCGGGHVAAAVVQLAKLLGLTVLAMDDREEYAQQLRLAGADKVLCLPFDKALAQVPDGAETYFVVVTRAHAFDVDCLKVILKKPAAYVGMMAAAGVPHWCAVNFWKPGSMPKEWRRCTPPSGFPSAHRRQRRSHFPFWHRSYRSRMRVRRRRLFICFWKPWLRQMPPGSRRRLAVIAARHGSTPREIGAKMLVRTDGSIVGSVAAVLWSTAPFWLHRKC